MATYSQQTLGIKAPSGGFQDLGWYPGANGGSFQYFKGTFGENGAIHPNSPQPGAGTKVSAEVNNQTAPGNQAYLDAYKPSVTPTPTTPTTTPTSIPGSTPASTGALTMPETPTLDLQGLYKTAQESSGVKTLQDEYTAKEQKMIEALAKNNDNPYLSESTRTGREAKIKEIFNNDTASLTKRIATAQADAEMQVNLASKQFDINSEVAKTNFDKFNSLLKSGALDNASGEDIANITRSTGISSAMIQSAIDANKKANTKSPNTQVIKSEADDGTVTISVINTDTGAVISQQNLGKIGNKQTGGATADKATQESQAQVAIMSYITDKNAQISLSPEEYVMLLMQKYPLAGITVADAQKIRDKTGQ